MTSDPAATTRRRQALEQYFAREVLSAEGFVCRNGAACRAAAEARRAGAYHEGQLSYLGPRYDLSEDGVPLRVLVAPMEVGRPPAWVTMSERASQLEASQRSGFKGRNQHMKGTTIALRLAFGREASEPVEHLAVDGRPAPLFDCFAMANLLLCSAVDAAGGRSLGTRIGAMRANCLPHLLETIRILEPTLLISQGVEVGRELGRVLQVRRRLTTEVAEAAHEGRRFAWVDLRNPSRNWFSPTQRYAIETALPALRAGRRLSLEIARGSGAAGE
jgi:hypothetical protein